MIKAPVKDQDGVVFVEEGIRFKLNRKCLVYSDMVLNKEGTYKIKVKVENYTGGCHVISIVNDQIKL